MKQPLVIILFLTLSCCTRIRQDQILINPESTEKTKIFISEYADGIQYIPLSFGVPVRSIRDIDFCNNLIFIAAGPEGMLVFNNDGRFIQRIGNKGKGPGEYFSVNSFTADPENNLIYMLDAGPKAKVLVYNYNGDFKYEFSNIQLNGNFQKITLLGNKLYLFEIFMAGRARYNWVELDLKGKVLATKINSIPNFNTNATILINPLYKYENGIGYWNQYNDTIFRIENGESSARFFFADGNFRLPMDKTEDFNKYFRVKNILESDKCVWIIEKDSPTNTVMILDKQEKLSKQPNEIKDKRTSTLGLINYIDGGLNFVPERYFKTNEKEFLLGWNNAFQLYNYGTSDIFKNSSPLYPEKKKELEQLANSLNENDNPVLILVKLKE